MPRLLSFPHFYYIKNTFIYKRIKLNFVFDNAQLQGLLQYLFVQFLKYFPLNGLTTNRLYI